jgi:Peptidase family M1 domain
LDGRETISYRSGADSAFHALYLHTYPNAFSSGHTIYAREAARVGEDYSLKLARPDELGSMTIDSVTVNGIPARAHLDETIARIDLPKPLDPGDSLSLGLHFRVRIPINFNRFGRTGDRYSIAQWYPKMVVYDELGWHPDPYHYLSEFYGEFATYDVTIDLPDRYWVGATGTLRDAKSGDNEIPFFRSEIPRESVFVALQVVLAGSLQGRPPEGLEVETDLQPEHGENPVTFRISGDRRLTFRIPRGAPVHYSYVWRDSRKRPLDEADAMGGAAPLHLVRAARDTAIVDTLRALVAEGAPGDTVPPSRKTLRFHAERVHDFAWVAAPDYVRSDTTWSGIRVRVLVFREDEARWREVKRQTVDAMRHHTTLVGPYVWPQFTTSEAFCGGGAMEYPMLIMNEPSIASTLFQTQDDTISHELGHNWFYGMLGSDERADPWLDEGFTQYVEQDYIDSKYPRGLVRYAGRVPRLGRFLKRDDNEQSYLQRVWARDEQLISTPADRYSGYPCYATGAYTKPASMLYTLRGILGDSVFVRFLHDYYRENLLRHPRPRAVVRAANEASGTDLTPYFHSWVGTLERPSFALGSIRRERNGDRWRTEVTVRRLGEMKLPVTVEGRFEDGTKAERRVLAADRETPAVFDSPTKLVGATLDPRHQLVEMNRLDNGTGLLAPMRFHFLYGLPSSEAIGVDWGPTVWHGNAEGVRLGAWGTGSYLPSKDFPRGILGFEGGLSIGTRSGAGAYRVGGWKRWGLLGARGEVGALMGRDEGLFRAGVRLGSFVTAPGRRHPYRSWALSAQYRDRVDLTPVDRRCWSLGRIAEGGLDLGLETIGCRRLETFELSYRHGASAFRESGDPAPGASYDWITAATRQSLDLLSGGAFKAAWRVALGSAFRRVPLERQFDIAEESRLEALQFFYANDRGPLRESDHFLVPGGGGVRGYAGRAVLGQRLIAWNLELGDEDYPVFAFGDVGRAESSGWGEDARPVLHPLTGKTLEDAGFGFRTGPVEVAFPVWVSRPEPDESPWHFRWLLSIGPIELPSP